MDRRKFIGLMAASGAGFLTASPRIWADGNSVSDALSALFTVPASTDVSGHVVIVGGGMAGATLAKYLRLWGGTSVKVTLIEKSAAYTSSIMSNLVLNGQRVLAGLDYTYSTLTSQYGVTLVNGTVTGINAGMKTVALADGRNVSYDRLVLAPGLEFDLLPGMTSLAEYDTAIPHAWKAGPQTQLLRDQLVAMPAGGNVIVTIPKAPYRCPPGPYERVCIIADWLKTNKLGSKVIVLDANADIVVERDNFLLAFNQTHAGIVDYRPNCVLTDLPSRFFSATAPLQGLAAFCTNNVGM
jgi:hypothetical protein